MTKSHWLDELIRDAAAKAFPRCSIRVVNKWGVCVCGLVPASPVGSVTVIENGEHNWEVLA